MFDAKLMEIGTAVVEANNNGTVAELLDSHYAVEAVSVEAAAMDDSGREASGLEAIRAKHDWWNSNFEVHESHAEGPFFHGDDRFSVIFSAETTHKESGKREQMREIGEYTVRDGKIVREEFFYTAE